MQEALRRLSEHNKQLGILTAEQQTKLQNLINRLLTAQSVKKLMALTALTQNKLAVATEEQTNKLVQKRHKELKHRVIGKLISSNQDKLRKCLAGLRENHSKARDIQQKAQKQFTWLISKLFSAQIIKQNFSKELSCGFPPKFLQYIKISSIQKLLEVTAFYDSK